MKQLWWIALFCFPLHGVSSDLLERRYNEVSYVFSHNGLAEGPAIVNNQLLTLKEQMKLGVRGTKTAVHYKEDWGGQKGGCMIMAAHGIDRNELYTNYYPHVREGLLKISNAVDKKVLMKLLGRIHGADLQLELHHLPELLKLYADGIAGIVWYKTYSGIKTV